jgi:hypothetical protein
VVEEVVTPVPVVTEVQEADLGEIAQPVQKEQELQIKDMTVELLLQHPRL